MDQASACAASLCLRWSPGRALSSAAIWCSPLKALRSGSQNAYENIRKRMIEIRKRNGALHLAVLRAGVIVADAVVEALGKRLFPVVSSMDRSQATAKMREMFAERDRRRAQCADNTVSKLGASAWSEDEIGLVSGMVSNSSSSAEARERAPAIRRELVGLNAIFDVYGKGGIARDPQIDGPIGQKGSERLAADVASTLISEVGRGEAVAALDPSIGFALALMDVNDRPH